MTRTFLYYTIDVDPARCTKRTSLCMTVKWQTAAITPVCHYFQKNSMSSILHLAPQTPRNGAPRLAQCVPTRSRITYNFSPTLPTHMSNVRRSGPELTTPNRNARRTLSRDSKQCPTPTTKASWTTPRSTNAIICRRINARRLQCCG